jgi:hypothetical protein
MMDIGTYRELHAKDRPPVTDGDLPEDVINQEEPPSGSFLPLLPPKIMEFGLHDKKWSRLT